MHMCLCILLHTHMRERDAERERERERTAGLRNNQESLIEEELGLDGQLGMTGNFPGPFTSETALGGRHGASAKPRAQVPEKTGGGGP